VLFDGFRQGCISDIGIGPILLRLELRHEPRADNVPAGLFILRGRHISMRGTGRACRRCMGGGPSCLEGSLDLRCQEVKHPQGFVPRSEVSHAGVGGLVAQIADQIPAGALLGRAEASPGGRALGVCDGRRLTRASCYPSPRPSVVFTREGGYKSAYRAVTELADARQLADEADRPVNALHVECRAERAQENSLSQPSNKAPLRITTAHRKGSQTVNPPGRRFEGRLQGWPGPAHSAHPGESARRRGPSTIDPLARGKCEAYDRIVRASVTLLGLMGAGSDGPDGLEWLAEHGPPDDAGAETQSRFRFQHECTARSCIAMLLDGGVVSVVCEEHEDFVVIYADRTFELVSVKHRENSQGPWNFASLCANGGVKHLYDRWLATGRRARCRVMTNAGLKPGSLEAGGFVRACQSREASRIVPFSSKLAKALGTTNRERASEFAVALSVESDLPDRRHIAAVNLRDLFWPALESLGVAHALAELCYEGVLTVIASANRDQVGERVDLRAALLDPARFDATSQADRRIRRRTITREAVLDVLQQQARPEASLVPSGPDATPAPPPSRLQRKLDAGGLGPTVIETAVQLRGSWYAFESARRASVPGGDPAFEELRLRVQELAGLSESRMDRSAPYGPAMHLDLRQTVTAQHLAGNLPFALDDQLLQGLVFQLTDECKVWFSDAFELGET
jgi:hypothetical protein